MSVLQDYLQIRGLLDTAVENALRDSVADGLKEAIQKKAKGSVYSYPASPSAMYKRREENGGLIDDTTMLTTVEGLTLTLENTAEPQNANGIDLTPIVEDGDPAWHQPFARPFMDEARDEYVDNGNADSDIVKSLRAMGFTVS